MGELELQEIETRVECYPVEARHDILRLLRELRRISRGAPKTDALASPLYDDLTGLLNGGAYGVRFAMARARATRYKRLFAVLSVAVDSSAAAEDHAFVIREVAARLERCLRGTDTLARIGDDEFAIIVEDLAQPAHAERVKQNVQEALAAPLHKQGRSMTARARVEMQFYPAAGAVAAQPA